MASGTGETIQLAAQPQMKAALVYLRVAETKLDKAGDDKGGHRVQALVLVRAAILETNKAITYDDSHANEAPDSDAEAKEAQPQMKLALASLRSAKKRLEKATSDKGGHRASAIKLVDEAIAEVTLGFIFDSRH